ncbi:MAG: fumarylacetoacetate hydrolase family protein [Deferrisomatales bacterium]|nr:fumarylacetoacetate hydrolase family protein [Deferrisomatales bacterium]
MPPFVDLPCEPRRVFCIGRNYAAHIAEMGVLDDGECVVFLKPSTSLVPWGGAVRLPRGVGAVHHELELVVALGAGGRAVPRGRARDLVCAATLGLDLTLRDVQDGLKARGRPWELAKAFDASAPLGQWCDAQGGASAAGAGGAGAADARGLDLGAVELSCRVNGTLRQQGSSAQMLFPVERVIEILSRTWELLPGDLIFTGTPSGVGPLAPGDELVAASPQLGSWTWRFD